VGLTAVHLVHATLTRRDQGPADPADVARILDILWAHATPRDALEHVRGRAGPNRIDLIIFIREGPVCADPLQQAVALLRRCHAASSHLSAAYDVPD
jgi:pyrimidine operon attenuation protein/uracil phosphoribosyltransferase